MKILFISDTHCYPLTDMNLPDADILVHSGDALSRGSLEEFDEMFLPELEKIRSKYKHILYIPGNHDRCVENNAKYCKEQLEDLDITLLIDQEIIIDGVKFYGSPWTPRFGHNWAFQGDIPSSSNRRDYNDIRKYWNNIPIDTDILITHGPPEGIMDLSIYSNTLCGCKELLSKIQEIEPSVHAFGHIHNWNGEETHGKTKFLNAAICDEKYEPIQSYHLIDFKKSIDK